MHRNRSRSHYILPRISNGNLNKYVKELGERAGWTDTRIKTRTKRGMPCIVYKNKEKREHYKFYDHLSTHTMRRTAITTMLRFGMDEWNVRQISGHAPGSKEFFRYVKLSQESIDNQSNLVHQKLQKID